MFDKLVEMKEEAIMLSLRTSDGIDLEAYKAEFGENLIAKHKDKISAYIKNDLLILTSDHKLKCTSRGFLVLNELIAQLI